MDLLQIIVLALVQGLTEFLPISSSAHLILVPRFLGWPDQGLAFDVAVHAGTLLAVLWYFRGDLLVIARAWLSALAGGPATRDARLGWAVLLGTVPVGLVGLLTSDLIEEHLRNPLIIGVTTVLFGVLLWLADVTGRRRRDEHSLTWLDILAVGCAQTLALVPGTSRSGITMTAAMAMGLTREGAARFSFLLAIPVISLAGLVETKDLLESTAPVDWRALGVGFAVSAASAYACIRLFLRFLERTGMAPFAVYRLALGAVIFFSFL